MPTGGAARLGGRRLPWFVRARHDLMTIPQPPVTRVSAWRKRLNFFAARVFVAYLLPIPAASLVTLLVALVLREVTTNRLFLQLSVLVTFLVTYILAGRALRRSPLYTSLPGNPLKRRDEEVAP